MTLDVILVSGLLLCMLAVPALVSAWADRRWPVIPAIALFGGAGLAGYAYLADQERYAPARVPDAFIRVLAELIQAI